MMLPKSVLLGVVLAALAGAACSKSNPASNPASPCSFTLGPPSSSSFGPEGGTGTASVTAGSGCSWTATSNAAFITISQGASGSGNGTVQFTVAANSAPADRTGTLTIAGGTLSITQRGMSGPPPPPPTPVTISAPTTVSPTGGQMVDSARPTLVVKNAAVTGNAGTVTYRFEVSDLPSFPDEPVRTFIATGVAQGNGTTSWTLNRDLGPDVLWYWRSLATNGTVTSAYSNVDTFRTMTTCSFAVSPNSVSMNAGGGTAAISVTTTSTCSWTTTSNASFITVTAGSAGTGTGTVTISVAGNTTGASRSGTVTVAGQTVTVTQSGSSVVAGFRLLDPGRGPEPMTECQIRSLTSVPTTCTLESTSYPIGTIGISDYAWTVQYIYPTGQVQTETQSGSNPRFSFSARCGQAGSSDSGETTDLIVTLTVTDSNGGTATVTSNAGSQPALLLRLFTCGI